MLSVQQYAKAMGVTMAAVQYRMKKNYDVPGVKYEKVGGRWVLYEVPAWNVPSVRQAFKKEWHHNDPYNTGKKLQNNLVKTK